MLQYELADSKREKLLDENLSLKGAIRVFARVRPPLPGETVAEITSSSGGGKSKGARGGSGSSSSSSSAEAEPPLFQFPNATDDCTDLEVVEKPGLGVGGYGVGEARRHAFSFQRVLPPTASQADVFEEVEGLVQSALDGHRVCIFAYGQVSHRDHGCVETFFSRSQSSSSFFYVLFPCHSFFLADW